MSDKMSVFYCQLDYAHTAYPSPSGKGNIADNGCGVCAAAMVAENLLGIAFPPEVAARLAIECKAREEYGTNLYIYSPVFADRVGLNVRTVFDASEALEFLQAGRGLVIANVAGNRQSDGYIGVFSDMGHYIVLAAASGTEVKVWDPMYREGSGRYDIPGRRCKVRLDGLDAYADISVIADDCKGRPFFLFEKRGTV